MESGVLTASMINTGINCFGGSLERNSGNSTIGSNYKLYFHKKGEQGFHGNQYVRTVRLDKIGGEIKSVTKFAGKTLGIAQVGIGAYEDYLDYQGQGQTYGYNMVRAVGECAGAWAGAEVGAYIGAQVGGLFYGVGAVPGAIIGGAVGGFCGALWGGDSGGQLIDYVYGK